MTDKIDLNDYEIQDRYAGCDSVISQALKQGKKILCIFYGEEELNEIII